MKASYKFIGSVIMMAALAACGGGDGGSDSNTDSKPDDSSKPPVEEPTSKLSPFIYYSHDHSGAREVKLDAEASSATITLGSDSISYTYDAANNSFSATGGYSMIGGLDGDNPGAQVCKDGKSTHLVLPADAKAAKLQDLVGKTFKVYEDCQLGDGKGAIPASVTFHSDGSLSMQVNAGTESADAAQVSALLSEEGLKETSSVTKLRPFLIGNQITIVFHSLGSGSKESYIAAWTYEP